MTYLATANTTLALCIAGCEWREVVMEHDLLILLDEHFVSLLHIHLGSEGNGCK